MLNWQILIQKTFLPMQKYVFLVKSLKIYKCMVNCMNKENELIQMQKMDGKVAIGPLPTFKESCLFLKQMQICAIWNFQLNVLITRRKTEAGVEWGFSVNLCGEMPVKHADVDASKMIKLINKHKHNLNFIDI